MNAAIKRYLLQNIACSISDTDASFHSNFKLRSKFSWFSVVLIHILWSRGSKYGLITRDRYECIQRLWYFSNTWKCHCYKIVGWCFGTGVEQLATHRGSLRPILHRCVLHQQHQISEAGNLFLSLIVPSLRRVRAQSETMGRHQSLPQRNLRQWLCHCRL